MKGSFSYQRIGLVTLFIWVASISSMENQESSGSSGSTDEEICQQVTIEDYKNLTQSMMFARVDATQSLKDSSSGWFSLSWTSLSDWWNGIDKNVATELREGTLTKEKVARDTDLQSRADGAILAAIEYKRAESLCDLLSQLRKFDMLAFYERHNKPITEFLNKEITGACEKNATKLLIDILETMQFMNLVIEEPLFIGINNILHTEMQANCVEKSCTKLLTVLRIMRTLRLSVDRKLHEDITAVLNDRQKLGVEEYKARFSIMQRIAADTLDQMKKEKDQYKDSFTETKDTVIELAWLNGENLPNIRKIKQSLGITETEQQFSAIIRALNDFNGKK
jgi:hypothetical protein